jgi:hypothetical protein
MCGRSEPSPPVTVYCVPLTQVVSAPAAERSTTSRSSSSQNANVIANADVDPLPAYWTLLVSVESVIGARLDSDRNGSGSSNFFQMDRGGGTE